MFSALYSRNPHPSPFQLHVQNPHSLPATTALSSEDVCQRPFSSSSPLEDCANNMSSTQDKNQLFGFEHSPTRRGTLDILYTCLPILVTCVWTSLHLDMTREPKPAWKRFSRKVGYMVMSIMVPEYMLGQAVFEHTKARAAVYTINGYHETYSSDTHPEDLWTLADGFFSEMKGFRYKNALVGPDEIVALMKEGKITPVRSYAQAIKDRSKADPFAKLFACTQALWLVIQCFARTAEGLPMSLLELGTIGYVLLSIVVYALLWYKPKDVMTHIDIPSKSSDYSEDMTRADNGDEEAGDPVASKPLLSKTSHPSESPIIHPFIVRHADEVPVVFLIVCCTIYGGYHCLAWNFIFPSPAEKWLWRISSLVTSLPIFWIFTMSKDPDEMSKDPDEDGADIYDAIALIPGVFYFLSRAIIIVEMFVSLRRMPAGVFETVQWTNLIPHF